MKETNLMKRIQIALSKIGSRVFRNNCGALRDRNGTWVKYGVARPGGSDLIGWTPVVITPEYFGRTLAIFTAVEVKKDDKARLTPEQENFIDVVTKSGGIAFATTSVDDAVERVHAIKGKRT